MRYLVCEANAFPVTWRIGRHQHAEQHEFVLVLGGSLQTQMAGKTWIAQPGTAVLHPAGLDHQECVVGGRPLSTLFLGWQAQAQEPLLDLPLHITDAHGRLAMAMRWLVDVCAHGNGERAGYGIIEGILFELRRLAARPEDELVAAVHRHARSRLSEPLRLGDLARAADLSRHHFSRRFQHSAGCTPMAYLRSMRIQRAHHLLVTTELPLLEIARQVGFPDRGHFSRVFRQITGLPPGQLRRSRRGVRVPVVWCWSGGRTRAPSCLMTNAKMPTSTAPIADLPVCKRSRAPACVARTAAMLSDAP